MNQFDTELQKIQERSNKALKRREFVTKYGALLVFGVLMLVNVCITPNFVEMSTIWNIIIQSTPALFVAMGMTFVIAIGGIDISVGSTMALCATTTTLMMLHGYPVLGSVLVGILIGLVVGLVIGVLTIQLKIQPMVLTLAMMIILRSISRIICDVRSVQVTDEGFISLSLTKFGEVPIQLVYVILIVIIFYVVAEFTVFGKSIEAIGNNAIAAKLSGIRSNMMSILAYVILGLLSVAAAMLSVSRSMNCNPSTFGSGMELDAIAAVVIGGTSMSGGKPRILGSMIGCFIMTLITMTVNMNGIDTSYSMLLKALIIIIAVYMQSDKSMKKKKIKAHKAMARGGQ
ncbi:ABC transporter permease [Christensenella timonensis]|uniref:ABC transporter permease n=1 Tax=Christensenella timonensis TaxID=1816678 RepID=UPI0009ED483A|nr:ABC transporter permease [Christensenella timonensis]